MPFCTYCGASFARDEHLERHILTHTGVRPYKCEWCHMSFARKDLLHRHQQMVHERNKTGDAPVLPITSKPAGRTPIACSSCAKNKTKCDKKFPCSRCAVRNLKCELRPTQRPSKKMRRPEVAAMETETTNGGDCNLNEATTDQPSQSESSSSGTSTPLDTSLGDIPSGSDTVCTPRLGPASSTHAQHVPMDDMSTPIFNSCNPGSLESPPAFLESFIRGADVGEDLWQQMQQPRSSYDQLDQWTTRYDASASYMTPQLSIAEETYYLTVPTACLQPGHSSISSTAHNSNAFDPLGHLSVNACHGPTAADVLFNRGYGQSPEERPAANLDAMVIAHEGWSAFRCNEPIPAAQCPRTARINLEKLEESMKSQSSWLHWLPSWDDADFEFGHQFNTVAIEEATRDKLLAITQSFLHKAFEIHSNEPGTGSGSPADRSQSSFVLLPPARVLDCCIKTYGNTFERFYPLTPSCAIDPNTIIYNGSDKPSSLLLLLMIAQGALASTSIDGRWFVGGLTEACRISLFDVIEKDIMMSGDPTVLHSSLLFTAQAGWSGDKWQMDIAMGQRGIYTSMLRHSGFLDGSQRPQTPFSADLEGMWSEWTWHEMRSRISHAWMMIDQELSLFHDSDSLLLASDLSSPMPDLESLWQARSAQEWSLMFEQISRFSGDDHAISSGLRPKTLSESFRDFVEGTFDGRCSPVTAMKLRMLLHPLQSLVSQARHQMAYFAGSTNAAASTHYRMSEASQLLDRWNTLCTDYLDSQPMCPTIHASIVLFHLITLNAITSIPDIERLARCESAVQAMHSFAEPPNLFIIDGEKALFHSGQVLRLVTSMPRSVRPPWWAAAIYRAALVLWCQGLLLQQLSDIARVEASDEAEPVFIDQLPPEHPLLVAFVSVRRGTPMLTRADGSCLTLKEPSTVLLRCVELISDGVQSRFTEGLCSKLTRLARA